MHQIIDFKKEHTILWDKVSQYTNLKLHTDKYNTKTNTCYGKVQWTGCCHDIFNLDLMEHVINQQLEPVRSILKGWL